MTAQTTLLRQRARAYGLAIGDITLDERFQQDSGARVQHIADCRRTARHQCRSTLVIKSAHAPPLPHALRDRRAAVRSVTARARPNHELRTGWIRLPICWRIAAITRWWSGAVPIEIGGTGLPVLSAAEIGAQWLRHHCARR